MVIAKVAYYDPTPWINPSDSLVEAIEVKLKADKSAKSNAKAKGKAYLPLDELELDIVIRGSGESLRLTEWVDRIGRFHLGLDDSSIKFRRGDFREKKYHHNPNNVNIPPPHHIHFPTVKCPLNGGESYAYPVKPTKDTTGEDYISALQLFCSCNNIVLSGARLPIIRRPS